MVFDQNTHFGLDSDMAPLPRMTQSGIGGGLALFATNITRRSKRSDFVCYELFCALPRLICVPSEGEKLVERDLAAPEVDQFGLHPMHKCAHLVNPADHQKIRPGRIGGLQKVASARARTWIRSTRWDKYAEFRACG